MEVEILKTKTDLSLDELNVLLNQETDVKIFKKLQYFKFKKMGFSKIESCHLAGIKESSRYYLDDLWEKGGYNNLIPHYGGGRKSKLKNNEIEELKEILKTKESWLIKDVQNIISNKYGVQYEYSGVRNLLIKFNIPIANYFENKKQNNNNILENINNLSNNDLNEIKEITNKITEEKSIFVFKKLSYILLRCLGYSNKQASAMYGITTVTGNNWLKTWKNEGYEGLKRKPGQGRKRKLSDENIKDLKKKLEKRDDWFLWEIRALIKKCYNIDYHINYLHTFLKKIYNIKFGKPYRRDYRQNPHYKSSFYLTLYQKLRKYKLKYDPKTGNIIDLKSNKKVLFFSFDEAAFQFVGNYVKVLSLDKPRMEMDTNKYVCKAAGFYSLTPEGNDYITFMENSRKETIAKLLKELKELNSDAIIFLTIDNFPSHTSTLVKDTAKELDIELCYLPPYSPQLQPIEKIWFKGKRGVMYYKISNIDGFKEMDGDEKLELLKTIVTKVFYRTVKSKKMWYTVDNNYIRKIIKQLHPKINSELEFKNVKQK